MKALLPAALLVLIPVSSGASAGGAGEGADAVLVRYDLDPLLTTYDDGFVESMVLLAGDRVMDHFRTDLAEMYGEQGPDSIVDVVTRLLGEELEYEGRRVDLTDDDHLLVLAPQEVQERVRSVLTTLEASIAGAAELQIDVVALADGTQPFGGRTVVEAAQVEGMLAAARGARETYRLRTLPGRTNVLHRMRRIPFVYDADIEISQGSLIHDPITGHAEVGTRILTRTAPVQGGLLISMFFANGAPLREQPVRRELNLLSYVAKDNGVDTSLAFRVFEEMEVLFRSVAFNSFLPDGKALVVSSEVDLAGQRSRQAVVIRRVGGGAAAFTAMDSGARGRKLFLINSESFQPAEVVPGGSISSQDDYARDTSQLRAELVSDSSVFLYDWVANRFSTWRTFGPWLMCVYDPSWDGAADEELERLAATWGPDLRLQELSVTTRSRGHGGSVPVAWRIPVRVGTDCTAMAGISGTILNDYDVEVAQMAAGGDPLHPPLFNGLAFTARPSIASSGSISLGLSALAHLQRGPRRPVDLGGPLMTAVEEATFDELGLDERLLLPAGGGTVVLGDSGGEAVLRLEVGVR